MLLKKAQLQEENAQPLFLDALLSEYGVGLKNVCGNPLGPVHPARYDLHSSLFAACQAGFFLADILKVVSKLSERDEYDVYECVMDFHELAKASDAERFILTKQSRKAGMPPRPDE